MFVLVTHVANPAGGEPWAKLLLYDDRARKPQAEFELELRHLPHEPEIGERFELVVA